MNKNFLLTGPNPKYTYNNIILYPPKKIINKNISPEKGQRKIVFQPALFRGYVVVSIVFRRVYTVNDPCWKKRHPCSPTRGFCIKTYQTSLIWSCHEINPPTKTSEIYIYLTAQQTSPWSSPSCSCNAAACLGFPHHRPQLLSKQSWISPKPQSWDPGGSEGHTMAAK